MPPTQMYAAPRVDKLLGKAEALPAETLPLEEEEPLVQPAARSVEEE